VDQALEEDPQGIQVFRYYQDDRRYDSLPDHFCPLYKPLTLSCLHLYGRFLRFFITLTKKYFG
jgi:hypothetical protein